MPFFLGLHNNCFIPKLLLPSNWKKKKKKSSSFLSWTTNNQYAFLVVIGACTFT
jgi:hypothetical protein